MSVFASFQKVSIIEVSELAAALSDFQVVDARPIEDFEKGHIPGSFHMVWEEWSQQSPGFWNRLFGDVKKWGKVVEDASVESRLRELGLSDERPIVVVGEPGKWGEEGRIAWNLLFWGAKQVSLLDGGFPAWVQAKHPSHTGKIEPHPRGTFRVALQTDRRATVEDIQVELREKKLPLLDVRSQSEFDGKKMQAQKRGGHIPGAQLVEVNALYAEGGKYIDASKLSAILKGARASKTALKESESPIAYCTGGVRSALLAVLVEARLGIRAKNYDGSIWEWSARNELPMVSGTAEK